MFSEGRADCGNSLNEDHNSSPPIITHPPLRMHRETFVSIAKEFGVPLSYLQMLKESATIFVDEQNVSSEANGDVQSFMIQSSFTSTTQFSVALTHDSKRCLTTALVHSLSKSEIANLMNDIIANRENVALPMLLPSLLLTSRVRYASIKVRESHEEIMDIEHRTGIRTNWHPVNPCCSIHQRQAAGKHRYDTIDFDRVTNDLTSLLSKLAYCGFLCEVHIPMLDSFDRINDQFAKSPFKEPVFEQNTYQSAVRPRSKMSTV